MIMPINPIVVFWLGSLMVMAKNMDNSTPLVATTLLNLRFIDSD